MNQTIFFDQIIQTNKNLNKTLTQIKGLGPNRVDFICKKLGLQPSASFEDLDTNSIDLLKTFIEQNFVINNHLDSKIAEKIRILIDSGSYKGKRHKLGYPVRGQRTKTNAKNQRRLSYRRFKIIADRSKLDVTIKDKFLNSELNKTDRKVPRKKIFLNKKTRYKNV